MDATDSSRSPADGYSSAPVAEAPKTDAMAFRIPKKETLLAFLNNGMAMMRRDETRQLLQETSIAKPGLRLVEMQRAEWDSLGVDRDFGCNCLERIQEDYEGDEELFKTRQEFVHLAERTYLQALVDRCPGTLECKKPMPRAVMIEFFNACNTKMGLPEFQEKLMRHIEETGKPPNELIVNMQRDWLEVFGFEKDFGCRQLSTVQTSASFKKDEELQKHFQRWMQVAQGTCMQLLKAHQMCSGRFPAEFMGDNPLMLKHGKQAKEDLDAMTPEERGALLNEKMKKKITIFAQLPPEAREKHMSQLSEEDGLEMLKAQILMMSVMKQQWDANQKRMNETRRQGGGLPAVHEDNEQASPADDDVSTAASGTGAPEAAPPAGKEVSKPAQQMMM